MYPSVDISRIVESVFREFRHRATLLSVTSDPHIGDHWLLRIQTVGQPGELKIFVVCGPGTSPMDVRQSVKRQLGLQ